MENSKSRLQAYWPRIAAASSAARMPGSSWATTKPPCSGFGGKSAARSSRRTCRATSSSSSARDRGPQPALVRAQHRPGRHRRPAPGAASGQALDGGHPGRPGRGDRRGVRGQVHAAVVVLGGSGGRKAHGAAAAQHVGDGAHERRCCRSSPAAANGSRSPSRPIRSTSTCCSRPRGSSGAASRAASPLACSASSRRGRDRGGPDRRHERLQRLGGIRRHSFGRPERPSSSTSEPRPNSRR